MAALDIACRAIQGARRHQEDAAALWPGPSTYEHRVDLPKPEQGRTVLVLADGMGGHAGGAVASITVCESFLAAMSGSLDLGDAVGDVRGDSGDRTDTAAGGPGETSPPETEATRRRMMRALDVCNLAINESVESEPLLEGMGATLIGAEIDSRGLTWISVGDSPLYLCRRGEIAQLNEDHSLAPMLDRLAAEGAMSRDDALADSRRHVLRSVVMGELPPLIDLPAKPLALAAGDVVVLASDGIHTIDTDEMARITASYLADGAGAIADALLRAVESQRDPYQDNTTLIVIRVT